MRHVGGRSGTLVWWVGLCGLGACSGTLHPSERASVTAETCLPADQPSRAADTAAITFRVVAATASSAERDRCALRLAAAMLRPWAIPSQDRWTVTIHLIDGGATVARLDAERARDAIDSGEALIATEDLDLVAYATARPGLDVTPLPWDRTYVRLSPGDSSSLGAAMSSDAVRVDARPAEVACDTLSGSTAFNRERATSTRVVYDAGDRTARELAERVVALVQDRSAAAVPLAMAELEAALHAGNELAYIVSLPRSADSACAALNELTRRVAWITVGTITPLVDTRAYAIVPRIPSP
jgi:hypothetical protein